MNPRLRLVSLIAATFVALTVGADQSSWASPAPEVGSTVAAVGDQTGGQLTITPITQAQYASSEELLNGHCSTAQGVTLCDRVTFDDSSLGVARWTAVAAVGHADDLYVDETVKTVENTKLVSTGHASGTGPWVRIDWVSPQHLGDPDGITIPGEANLQFLTTVTIPGGGAPSAYCAGPEQDYEYQITCGTWIPSNW